MDEQFEGELLSGMKATEGAYWCFRKGIGTALVYLEVARDAVHAHEGDDVTYKGEVPKDDNNVTCGPATGTETAALLEQRPESGDGSLEVQRQTIDEDSQCILAGTDSGHGCPSSGWGSTTSLSSYNQAGHDAFDHWFKCFEERNKLAGWSSERKLCQLKLLLDKTADRVFHMLSETDCASYEKATQGLHLPVDAGELCDLESSNTSPKKRSPSNSWALRGSG